MIIAHNLMASNAGRQNKIVGNNKKKATEKLASGYRINRASDDAAGLSISEKMRSQIRGLTQGANNVEDGISYCQVADGALAEVAEMLHRITELSVQSANDTNTPEDRACIQEEISQIIMEIDRIGETTEYNTRKVFQGDYSYDSAIGGSGSASQTVKLPGESFDLYISGTSEDPEGTKSTVDSSTSAAGGIVIKKTSSDSSSQPPSETVVDMKTIPWGNVKDQYGNQIDLNNIDKDNTYNLEYENLKIKIVPKREGTVDDLVNDLKNKEISRGRRHSQGGTGGESHGSQNSGEFWDSYGDLWIQSGANSYQGMYLQIGRMDAEELGIDDLDVSTREGAEDALGATAAALDRLSEQRSRIGAQQNRLEHSLANDLNTAENLQAAESRIRDADMAKEMSELAKQQILEQAGTSMITQANQSTEGILNLLR